MAVDTNIIISSNVFAGFQNYNFVTFSVSYPGATIPLGGFVGPIRAQTPLNNNNAVGIVELQYQGIDSFTRLLPGAIVLDYPSNAITSYQIQSYSYYSGGNLIVDTYIINETGSTTPPGSVVIPAIVVNVTAGLYQAPF